MSSFMNEVVDAAVDAAVVDPRAQVVELAGTVAEGSSPEEADDSPEVADVDDLPELPETDQASEPPLARYVARLAERLRASRRLPRGVRERLSELVERLPVDDQLADDPTAAVAEAVTSLEDALPEQLQLAAEEATAARHPQGDGFFTGDGSDLSDDDAARIAAEQLSSTGWGR